MSTDVASCDRLLAFDRVPLEMRAAPRWMNYKLEPDPKHPEKPRKVPYRSRTFDVKASSTNPKTWAPFTEAVYAIDAAKYDGVGFALGDGFVGVDCDHCIDESGAIKPWAREIIDRLNSYTEYSPSVDRAAAAAVRPAPSTWKDR